MESVIFSECFFEPQKINYDDYLHLSQNNQIKNLNEISQESRGIKNGEFSKVMSIILEKYFPLCL